MRYTLVSARDGDAHTGAIRGASDVCRPRAWEAGGWGGGDCRPVDESLMDQEYPLARLGTIVALARARTAPTRLLLRNSSRFGVIHLYFAGGRLVSVEGHRDSPVSSLADLGTWRGGSVRTDDAQVPLLGDPDPRLEVALAHALQELAAHGAMQTPSLPRSRPTPRPPRTAPSAVASQPTAPRPVSGVFRSGPASADVPPVGLPPLSATPEVPVGPPAASSEDNLTAPQWQLIALTVRQVVTQAGAEVGEPMSVRIFGQALAHAARTRPVLAPLSIELSGWLTATPPDAMLQFRCDAVVEAVADVLAGFETRCASLVGAARAQGLIVAAVGPFRQGLAQIGLEVAG